MSNDDTQSDGEQRDGECPECGHVENGYQDVGDGKAYCCSECGEVWKVEGELVADGGVSKERFQIEVNDEVTLSRNSMVEHADHGAMTVDQISVGANYKRARLKSQMREDGLSIELTGEEIREQWGDTIAADPFELREDGHASYEKYFSSSDERLQIEISVSGPKERAEPAMAHLDDQVYRVLEALEERKLPENCEGRFDIDWETIFEKVHGGANLNDF